MLNVPKCTAGGWRSTNVYTLEGRHNKAAPPGFRQLGRPSDHYCESVLHHQNDRQTPGLTLRKITDVIFLYL